MFTSRTQLSQILLTERCTKPDFETVITTSLFSIAVGEFYSLGRVVLYLLNIRVEASKRILWLILPFFQLLNVEDIDDELGEWVISCKSAGYCFHLKSDYFSILSDRSRPMVAVQFPEGKSIFKMVMHQLTLLSLLLNSTRNILVKLKILFDQHGHQISIISPNCGTY